jgi:hypothetical protein
MKWADFRGFFHYRLRGSPLFHIDCGLGRIILMEK